MSNVRSRLQDSIPAHKALAVYVSSSLGRPPDSSWRCRPGQPRGRWFDQIWRDTGQTPANHWRQAQRRGHWRGEGMPRPTMATRQWWWSSYMNPAAFILLFFGFFISIYPPGMWQNFTGFLTYGAQQQTIIVTTCRSLSVFSSAGWANSIYGQKLSVYLCVNQSDTNHNCYA